MITKNQQSPKTKKTYTDAVKLPEGAPYQLINGMLVKSPSPVPTHQEVVKKLFLKLAALETMGLGKAFFAPPDVYLSETETYQPDVLFISNENRDGTFTLLEPKCREPRKRTSKRPGISQESTAITSSLYPDLTVELLALFS